MKGREKAREHGRTPWQIGIMKSLRTFGSKPKGAGNAPSLPPGIIVGYLGDPFLHTWVPWFGVLLP